MKSISEELKREIIQALQTCTNCKFCTSVCPLYEFWIREAAVGKIFAIYYIIKYNTPVNNDIKNILWYCTTCGYCDYICKKLAGGIKSVEIIEKARRLLLHEYKIEPIKRHSEILKDIQMYYNPYYTPNEERWKWLSFDLPYNGKYLYFIGCTAAFRMQNVAKATIETFKKLNVNLAMFSKEKCCCSVLLRIGFIEEAFPIIEENFSNINNSGSKYLITSCAGCYKTLKIDYPKLVGDFNLEILHSSELAQRLLENNKLKINNKDFKNKRITYHDPCHLGRHANLYDAPRAILSSIQGIEFIEMKNNRENSICCGCGGGFRSGFTSKSFDIAAKRLSEAKELGVDILVTCCPFCELQLSKVSQERGYNIKVIDLMELLANIISK